MKNKIIFEIVKQFKLNFHFVYNLFNLFNLFQNFILIKAKYDHIFLTFLSIVFFLEFFAGLLY